MRINSGNLAPFGRGLVLVAAVGLAACGVEDVTPTAPASSPATARDPAGGANPAVAGSSQSVSATTGAYVPRDLPASPTEASRFLAKATFGATPADIDAVMARGYSGWIDDQMTKTSMSHVADFGRRLAQLPENANAIGRDWPNRSFWRAALSAEDPLRQRVAYALSQIFVVSLRNGDIGERMAAAYLDVLARNAFGNYRQLLEEVTLSPAMGVYLSAMANRKADLSIGRLPDENYAREIMQLFSIGLYELNPDGTVKLDARNEPIETYDMADIAGLARVFTGFSWAGPDTSAARFGNNALARAADRDILPMQGYPQFHETGSKSFLGQTVTASTPEASLKAALDILFNHPNVGPFIGRQLIQRLVTSNPSPAYVGRVSAAFANNGQGVRGDMKAVVKAVLLDPEAMNPPAASLAWNGRLREPLLRMTTMLRALDAKSASGEFMLGVTDDPATSLGMSALRAPTVFNFYRPGYVPPHSGLAERGLVAPELQIVDEVNVAGFLNTVKTVLDLNGIGANFVPVRGPDVQLDLAPLMALARDPAALVDRAILLMSPGQVPTSLRNQMVGAVGSVVIPAGPDTQQNVIDARRNRARLAVMLLVASPAFAVQR